MFACEKGYEDIVKQLLGTPNCDITLKDNVREGQEMISIIMGGAGND